MLVALSRSVTSVRGHESYNMSPNNIYSIIIMDGVVEVGNVFIKLFTASIL